jgi:hypothetical protein
VVLRELQLSGLLDGDDAVAVRDGGGQRVQERRLAGARSPGDQDVQVGLDAAVQEVGRLGRERSDLDQLVESETALVELPDRQERSRERQRRDDRIDP